MGVRGRRRELGDSEDPEDDCVFEGDGGDSDGGGPSRFIPASLVESNTDDILANLCEDFRRKSLYLRYVCAGDLRLWVRRYHRYPNKNARCEATLCEFLECALTILEDEQYAPCSEDPPMEFPNCPREKLLGAMRYQLCQKLSKYF